MKRVNPKPVYWDIANVRLVHLNNANGYDEIPTGGSGGGLESYQNAVMSAPVQAYVYRDADDNITRVYEPLRNNIVSRSQFAYADSIDKFPFGSVDCFGSAIKDLKLIDVATDIKIQGCSLETMIIDAGSHTGLQLINHRHIGNYGLRKSGSTFPEISISGNNVSFIKNSCQLGTFFEQLGADSIINQVNFSSETSVFGNGFKVSIEYGESGAQATIFATKNNGGLYDFYLSSSSEVVLGDTVYQYITLNTSATLGDIGNVPLQRFPFKNVSNVLLEDSATVLPASDNLLEISNSHFGVGIEITVDENSDGLNVQNIGGTAYKLGVTAGSVTATAI